MSKTVPNAVREKAEKIYCNDVEYIGKLDGLEVYREQADEQDTPEPTGLPVLILWDGNRVKTVSGIESLDLLSRFE